MEEPLTLTLDVDLWNTTDIDEVVSFLVRLDEKRREYAVDDDTLGKLEDRLGQIVGQRKCDAHTMMWA